MGCAFCVLSLVLVLFRISERFTDFVLCVGGFCLLPAHHTHIPGVLRGQKKT